LPRALARIGGGPAGVGGSGRGVHGDVDRGDGVCSGASGDLSVGERSASGGMGGEGRGASHGDRGNRTRRLDGLPGAVLGRIGALEDGNTRSAQSAAKSTA